METGWYYFRISFFYFPYTNMIFIIFVKNWLSSVVLIIGSFKFKFFVIFKIFVHWSCNSFSSAITILFSTRVIFRRFTVFITEIWPDSFAKCFIITNFFNVHFFQSKLFWFYSTGLNSNFFVRYKRTSFRNFSFCYTYFWV